MNSKKTSTQQYGESDKISPETREIYLLEITRGEFIVSSKRFLKIIEALNNS